METPKEEKQNGETINIFKTIIQENFLEIKDLNVILKKPTVYLEKLTQNGQLLTHTPVNF